MSMIATDSTIAQQLALVTSRFQEERTGHAPSSVTVVLSEDTLVVTMHEALTPAEIALAKTPGGLLACKSFIDNGRFDHGRGLEGTSRARE